VRRFRTGGGFSLPELLVVLTIVGLSVGVAVPLVSHQVRMLRIRGAAAQFAADLRAARMIAVARRETVDVQVDIDPVNVYSFPGVRGDTRRMTMPEGIRIVSCTPSRIRFRPDGSVPPPEVVTVFEARTSGGWIQRWTIKTGLLGVPKLPPPERVPGP
jgi:prepilin-type N-terminal cleavage/methylation domain-containing protein